MDNFVIASDRVTLYNRSADSRIKEVASCCPRSPLNLKDLQIAPDGRQVLLISSIQAQGNCFACLNKGQDHWLYHDFIPTEFTVTCGVFSPKLNYIAYLGTSTGAILQYDLKATKQPAWTTLTKSEREVPITSIDVNCAGTQLAVSMGGFVLVHSLRNKVDNSIEYDSRPNAKTMVRFHPARQFALGVFSQAEGAAFVDLSCSQPFSSKSLTRIRPLPGEGHVCEPASLLWVNSESLCTAGDDGRVVQYNKKSCAQVYRHTSGILCADVLKDGAELVIGLDDTFACLDIRKKKIIWTKSIQAMRPVQFIARAKSYLPVASSSTILDIMYPQRIPANPEIRSVPLLLPSKTSYGDLISPLKGDFNQQREAAGSDFHQESHVTTELKGERSRKSSIGMLISPPKSQTNQIHNFSMPQRRTLPHLTIKEESTLDAGWKENETNMFQSTKLHGDESRCVDLGLDSTSPVRSLRPPLLSKHNRQSTPTIGKDRSLFCNVDTMRNSPKLNQETNSDIAAHLERQTALLESLVESSARIESKISDLIDEVQEQGGGSRILVGHSIQLFKSYHQQTVDMLRDIADSQNLAWMEPLADNMEKL